jgi:hypothetical protein
MLVYFQLFALIKMPLILEYEGTKKQKKNNAKFEKLS